MKRPEKKTLEELERLYIGKPLTKEAMLDIENSECSFRIYVEGTICHIQKSRYVLLREEKREV